MQKLDTWNLFNPSPKLILEIHKIESELSPLEFIPVITTSIKCCGNSTACSSYTSLSPGSPSITTTSTSSMRNISWCLARVLALEPEVLLLDEPFSHIDNFRKNSLRRRLFAYLKEKGITCIVATHDSTDVLSFADEVLVMQKGIIIEKGTPKFIYENPENKYVASLFGDVNEILMDGKVQFVYPHQLEIVEESGVKVEVLNSYFRGSHYLIKAKHNEDVLFFESKQHYPKHTELFLAKTM